MTSKYDALGAHLAAIGAATIILTFAEIEAVVGPLPRAARRTASWWGQGRRALYLNPHVLYWRQAGYVTEQLDFAAETVTFRRVLP